LLGGIVISQIYPDGSLHMDFRKRGKENPDPGKMMTKGLKKMTPKKKDAEEK
jgi:hypothetical protein